MLIEVIKSDRFSLVVLAMALAAGGMWYLQPQLGWLPLLLAIGPWILKAAVDTFPFQPSVLDVPMALFLATAAGGLWLSYDQEAAQVKYWLIIGAVIIYYAMVIQPRDNLWLLGGVLTLFGVGVGAYFLMTHDWQVQPARLAFFNELGLRWMAVRPSLGIDNIHPNVAAGLTALVSPFSVALFLRGLRSANSWHYKLPVILFSVGSAAFFLFVLLVTTSRGAWLALGAALVLWLVWEGSSYVGEHRRQNPGLIFGVILFTFGVVGLFLILTHPGGPVGLINQLPGPSNIGSRAELVRGTLYLIGDFSISGSGLGSFPGLYSNYNLILPTFVLGHSHNLFLDITLEQGPLGLLAFLSILIGSLLLLVWARPGEKRVRHLSQLRGAVVSSLLVMVLHGLIDDPLYGSRAVLFLFLVPGMATAIFKARSWDPIKKSKKNRRTFRISSPTFAAGVGFIVISCLFIGLVNLNTILSDWYANLGAIEMARVELVDWPTDQWDDGRNAASLAPAVDIFNKSLAANPMNSTAHYRLGLAAMLNQNFEEAVGHLEAAYQKEPFNQGVQKTLGYSYVWLGDFDKAFDLLRFVHESSQELNVYVTWWNRQGRSDLSTNAAIMEQRLQSAEIVPVN